MTGSYRLCDHTADVGVAARGESLDEVFAAVADGLAAAMCDDVPETPVGDADAPGDGERFAVSVTAESREALLFDYLDQLIYERDVRGVLPIGNEAEVHGSDGGGDGDGDGNGSRGEGDWTDGAWRVEANALGVPLSAVDAREVKAVTYSEMRIERVDGGWEAYVVFDV